MKEKMSLKGERLTTKELERDAPNEGKIVKSDNPGSKEKKREIASRMVPSGHKMVEKGSNKGMSFIGKK